MNKRIIEVPARWDAQTIAHELERVPQNDEHLEPGVWGGPSQKIRVRLAHMAFTDKQIVALMVIVGAICKVIDLTAII